MCRACRECFPRHRLQRKQVVNDPGMHYGTCATHMPWYMSGSLTRGGGGNVPGIPGACASRNFTYLARAPLYQSYWMLSVRGYTQWYYTVDLEYCHRQRFLCYGYLCIGSGMGGSRTRDMNFSICYFICMILTYLNKSIFKIICCMNLKTPWWLQV